MPDVMHIAAQLKVDLRIHIATLDDAGMNEAGGGVAVGAERQQQDD